MKEKKKKRKILAALIPVAVLFLAVVVFAQGVCRIQDRWKRRGSGRAT